MSLVRRVVLPGVLLTAGCLGPPTYANPRRSGAAVPAAPTPGEPSAANGGALEAASRVETPSPTNLEETVQALESLCSGMALPEKFAVDVDAATYPADGSRPVRLFVRSGVECGLLVVRSGPEGLVCLTRDHRDYDFGTHLWSANAVTLEPGGRPGAYRLFVYALRSQAASPGHGESLASSGVDPQATSAFYSRLAEAMEDQGIAASEARYTVE
ncbi:MAG: hypothetical protein HY722_14765 [Planctomycetes bacterium]|nr:hypothetical protein [Planctomycetota bacterium]